MIHRFSLFTAYFLVVAFSLPAQEEVNLFEYWKYFSDAENSLYKASCSIAFGQLDQRKKAIDQLVNKNDHLQRQAKVRSILAQSIGKFPAKTPLNARITGVVERKDYTVEKLIYESMPGFYVTAAIFLPKGLRGRAPAIIYASGHTANGYRSETYQHIIINLVKKGFVVLAFDPVGQGERLQYFDDAGEPQFGPTVEHSYPGAQCYLAGYSPAKYFIWDGIRTVDYLLTRKEVDPNRIGMTGRSGGGTQTAYTAAMDDRILAAAPECFITSMEYILKSIGPQDAEQNVMHMMSRGLDHADLLEVRAPKPGLMITTTGDFFSIQGARETFREVQQFYETMGAGDRFTMVEDDDVHASTLKNREAMYAFFQKHLGNPGSSQDLEVKTFEEQELWSTATGQLNSSLQGETLFSLNKKLVEEQLGQLADQRRSTEHLESLSTRVANISGFEYPSNFDGGLFSGRTVKANYTVEKYMIPRSNQYAIPVAVFKPPNKGSGQIIVLLNEQGMEHAVNQDSLVRIILEQGHSVLLFDVPGLGSLGPGYLKGDAYIDNTSYNQWFAGILTNKSTLAIRTEDVVRVIQFAKNQVEGVESVSLLSVGSLGSEMLHAALFDPDVGRICLVRPFLSFAGLALSFKYSPRFIPSTVAGALRNYDLPDLMAGLAPRQLSVINPVDSEGAPLDHDVALKRLVYPTETYTDKGAREKMSIHFGDEISLEKRVIEWVNAK